MRLLQDGTPVLEVGEYSYSTRKWNMFCLTHSSSILDSGGPLFNKVFQQVGVVVSKMGSIMMACGQDAQI